MRADDLAILLPARRRFAAASLHTQVARLLGRADVLDAGTDGFQAQLQRWFAADGARLPMAALLADADDDACWIKLEPAYVRAEMGVLRLLAFGDDLGLSDMQRAALAQSLSDVLQGEGWEWRECDGDWFLRSDTLYDVPDFAMPDDLLGADILDHYPPPFWRARFAEAQIVLHQSGIQRQRESMGQVPVNALLFWGAGRRSTTLSAGMREIDSGDAVLLALSRDAQPSDDALTRLLDRRHARDFDVLFNEDIAPALVQGRAVRLDFADGTRLRLHAGQRWRFWRRAYQLNAHSIG